MHRPLALLRAAALVVTLSLGAGCASNEASRCEAAHTAAEAERDARHAHVHEATESEDEATPQMTVQGDEGTLNAADIESALHDHMDEIRDCYRVGKKAAPRDGARVMLRFYVDGKGEVQDVSIVESNLGSRGIEHCLADIAVGVVFEPPTGHKPMTFDYPVEFRSAAPLTADRQRRP
jgi:TonB family protein